MDLSSALLESGTVNDEIYSDTMKEYYSDRTLLMNTVVTDDVLEDIILHILLWNKDDKDLPREKRQPIKLYLDSDGGSVFAANNLIDVIRTSETPVYAIGFSMVASAAFSIFISCDKRYAFEHTVFLIHDGSKSISNSGSKARDFMDFLDRIDDLDKELILERTSIPEEDYEKKKRDEQFFFSAEAKDKSIVDEIIGVDCALDDIL